MRGRVRRASSSSLLASSLTAFVLAASLRAQSANPQADETLPGFKPNNTFEVRGIDNVNVYNGDPNVVVPLGPEYPLGPGTSFQLKAYYSVKFWHFDTNGCPADPNQSTNYAYVTGYPTLGAGWTLELGYITTPSSPAGPAYHSPDGGRHAFTGTAPVYYTNDGTHLRITSSASPPYWKVEFPDGTTQQFNQAYQMPRAQAGSDPNSASSPDFFDLDYGATPDTRYGLTDMYDSFGSHLLSVSYVGLPNTADAWKVHQINFNSQSITYNWTTYQPSYPTLTGPIWPVLSSISFPSASGNTLSVDFASLPGTNAAGVPTTMYRNSYDNSAGSLQSCQELWPQQDVPLLGSISFHGPALLATYLFAYATPTDDATFSGALKTITLPTSGTIGYSYAPVASFCVWETSGSCNDPETGGLSGPSRPTVGVSNPYLPYLDKSAGVATRTENDTLTGLNAMVTYSRATDIPTKLVGGNPVPDPDRVARWAVVTGPDGNGNQIATRYVFHTDVEGTATAGAELERRYYQDSNAAGTPIRTLINCHESDTGTGPVCGFRNTDGTIAVYTLLNGAFGNGSNLRRQGTVTWFGENPRVSGQSWGWVCPGPSGSAGCQQAVSPHSSYNLNAGKYNDVQMTSSLQQMAGWTMRTTTTNWTPSNTGSWLLSLFSYKKVVDAVSGTPQPPTTVETEAPTVVAYPDTTHTTVTRTGSDSNGTFQEYAYDGFGRLLREVRQMPSAYSYRTHKYDIAGHAYFLSEWKACSSVSSCLTIADPPGTTQSSFDPFGRPRTITRADGSATTISRVDGAIMYSDSREAVTKTVNGASATTAKRRDMLGRVINLLEPAVNGSADLTTYTYDALDKLATVSQTAQSRTFGYDYSGFLRSESTPERGSVSYTLYDALGDLKTKTDGGVIYTYVYDTAGRLQTLSTNEGGSRTYLSNTYDQNPSATNLSYGRLTQQVGTNYAVTPSMTVTDSFTYGNAAGRLSLRQTSFSSGVLSGPVTQSWFYNSLGLIAQHNHPRPANSANFVEYTAYTAGLPTTEYGAGINLVTNVGYQPAGALGAYETGVGTGHDVTTTIGQNAATLMPRPASISTSGASSNFVSGTYGYDGVGNITSIGSDSFTYDARSRLTEASLATLGNPQWYCYDLYGNLFSKVFSASQPSCGSTVWTNNRISGASYDGRGNVLTDGADSYTYDALDRMLQHTTSEFKYLYDGSNERQVRIPATGSWTYTLRDESERLTTEFSGTVWSRDNMFLGNLLLGSYANSAVSGNGPVWSFYASDHLGTPRIVTDISGTTVDSRKSWPYGEDATTPGTFQRVRFASMERDTEGSRYYDHARLHEFGRGRFVGIDRLGGQVLAPQSWNRYTYALANPLRLVDPNGLELAIAFKGTQSFLVDSTIQQRVQILFDRIETLDLKVQVNFAFRTTAEQAIQYRLKRLGLNPNKVAPPTLSRHESGFAIDFGGLGSLNRADRAVFDSLVREAGLSPIRDDPPHFEADPTAFGYKSRAAAIRANQADYRANFEGESDIFGTPFDETAQPNVATQPLAFEAPSPPSDDASWESLSIWAEFGKGHVGIDGVFFPPR